MGANESGAPWPSLAPFTPTNATGAEGSTPLPFATEEEEVLYLLGPVRDPMSTVIPMTLVYALIFTTGLLGNVCTCIVIARNKYMHTTVNYYLFSLSVSDLLLLVLGLPQELWMLWKKYPYVFGDTFCILRAFTSETCTNASVLTITAFTIERYIAICHPLKAHTMANLPRAVKTILCIWAVAALCSIPIAFQLGVIHQVSQLTGADMASSGQCAVKRPVPRTFEVATGLFFVLPMTVISILYLLIGYQLRKSSRTMAASKSNGSNGGTASGCGDQYQPSSHHRDSLAVPIATGRSRSDSCVPQSSHFRSGSNKHHSSSRRAVIKMLVAVVASFFICWSPFHAQRILATNIRDPNGPIMTFYQILTYISGVTYYMTATINPILYQLMSLKFRLAFKDTFGCWCPFLKPPEKHPDYTYSTVMVNGTALNGPESRFGGSFRAGGSFRGSISAHQLNNMPSTPEPGSKRVGEPRGQVGQSSTTSSVIKCANNGNGSSTLLTVPSGPMTGFRSTSCTDVFPSNNGGRRCLIQSSSPTPSTVTFEDN